MRLLPSLIVLALALLLSTSAHAAIYWVGNSAACSGSSVRPNVPAAMLSAQASPEADEIRLTKTIDYVNTVHSKITVTDWNPSVRGALTLSGGYADCFSAQSGRTVIGDDPGTIFTVSTSSEPSSVVTLKNLEVTSADVRGLAASGGAEVTLDNILMRSNGGGILVSAGGYVDVLATTTIQENGNSLALAAGGGIQCTGSNSAVSMRGKLISNAAVKGGNLYLSSGCFVELFSGALIQGNGVTATSVSATSGAGAYVDAGGELFSSGGNARVTFEHLRAENGAAVFVNGTGKATFLNTYFGSNRATRGSVLYAQNGGTVSPQVSIERSGTCAFGVNCSHIDNNRYAEALIYLNNSMLDISHTVVELNEVQASVGGFTRMLIFLENNSHTRLDHVGFLGNIAEVVIYNASGKAELTHNTIADNWYSSGGPLYKAGVATNYGIFDMQNSVIDADSNVNNVASGSALGKCNLVGDPGDMPPGSYFIGTPIFVDINNGNAHQQPSSPGVDMCQNDYYAWSPSLDIESQVSPVNEFTNPQGNPGEAGGLYDAGFDEVYSNIANDEFTMTVSKNGTGSGTVVSAPVGIACGGDCSEVYFQGTLVTLNAVPAAGSVFAGWGSCPLPNGTQCQAAMSANRSISAIFNVDVVSELIFADGFEDPE